MEFEAIGGNECHERRGCPIDCRHDASGRIKEAGKDLPELLIDLCRLRTNERIAVWKELNVDENWGKAADRVLSRKLKAAGSTSFQTGRYLETLNNRHPCLLLFFLFMEAGCVQRWI